MTEKYSIGSKSKVRLVFQPQNYDLKIGDRSFENVAYIICLGTTGQIKIVSGGN
jgi:hypothetical protein